MSEPLDIEKELEDGRKPGNQTFFKDENKNLLIVTRGHPFERDNFFNTLSIYFGSGALPYNPLVKETLLNTVSKFSKVNS